MAEEKNTIQEADAKEVASDALSESEGNKASEHLNTKGAEQKGLGSVSEPDVTDKHGQAGISKGKYERDIAAKDAEIAALKAKVEEAAKTEKGRQELTAQVDALKAELEGLTVTHKLELAGCRSVKAAKVLLDDFEGDIDKLKEAMPFLFEDDKPKGTTGLKPQGAADDMESRLAKARADLGLPAKKKE